MTKPRAVRAAAAAGPSNSPTKGVSKTPRRKQMWKKAAAPKPLVGPVADALRRLHDARPGNVFHALPPQGRSVMPAATTGGAGNRPSAGRGDAQSTPAARGTMEAAGAVAQSVTATPTISRADTAAGGALVLPPAASVGHAAVPSGVVGSASPLPLRVQRPSHAAVCASTAVAAGGPGRVPQPSAGAAAEGSAAQGPSHGDPE